VNTWGDSRRRLACHDFLAAAVLAMTMTSVGGIATSQAQVLNGIRALDGVVKDKDLPARCAGIWAPFSTPKLPDDPRVWLALLMVIRDPDLSAAPQSAALRKCGDTLRQRVTELADSLRGGDQPTSFLLLTLSNPPSSVKLQRDELVRHLRRSPVFVSGRFFANATPIQRRILKIVVKGPLGRTLVGVSGADINVLSPAELNEFRGSFVEEAYNEMITRRFIELHR
jgi:hypothetical protein